MKFWFRINDLKTQCSWLFVYQEIKKALLAEGHTVHPDPFNPPKDVEDYVEMWWTDPRHWIWSKLPVKMKVGIVLSEAPSLLKECRGMAIKSLQLSDLLIIPTEFSAIAYKEYSLDMPMVIVPFGVDDTKYCYVERDWSGDFRFLHYGVAQFRKGSWMVPEAFIKAFKEKKNVSLTISAFRTTSEYNQLFHEYGKHPRIKFTDKMHEDSFQVYKDYHVLVSPHLSEGWGLCIPEAMATGMPCLVSRCSSPREYFSSEFGWWIEMSENYVPVSRGLKDTEGFWRLPDVDSLTEVMKESYEDRDTCKIKGEKASVYVLSNLTWKLTARKIVEAVDKTTDTLYFSHWR